MPLFDMIVTIDHSTDASVDFAVDAIFCYEETPHLRPYVRECVNGLYVPIDSTEAKFTVLAIECLWRSYSGAVQAKAPVYQLTLMDGSEVCFCAFLTVSSSMLLDKKLNVESKELPIGSTIIVRDHVFLPLAPSNTEKIRGALVISDMAWRMPPNHNVPSKFRRLNEPAGGGRLMTLLEERKTTRIDSSVLDLCQQSMSVVFTRPRRVAGGPNGRSYDVYLAPATELDIVDSITDASNRERWHLKMASRTITPSTLHSYVDQDPCACVSLFGAKQCLAKLFPVRETDKEEVYYTVKNLGLAERHWLCFDEMPEAKKAWCLRWWYSVNYTQNCKVGIPLPGCVKDCIAEHCKSL